MSFALKESCTGPGRTGDTLPFDQIELACATRHGDDERERHSDEGDAYA